MALDCAIALHNVKRAPYKVTPLPYILRFFRKKRERVPECLRFFETKHGKTTVRRYSGRTSYRFEEVKGKPVDFVHVFTAGESHSIQVRFEDKTALHFAIDPGFTLDTEYADWKTGNWRPIKRWALIRRRDAPNLRGDSMAGTRGYTCCRRPSVLIRVACIVPPPPALGRAQG